MIIEEDITFVITCYKSEILINETLKNIPKDSKKIIIENSGNFELKSLEKNFSNLQCFIMNENVGYGAANNIGILNSSTNYIFILNPDVILKKNDVTKILNQSKNLDFSILGFTSETEKVDFIHNKKFIRTNEVKGFAMLLRKKDIINCLFDENIFLYLEEIDMCKRVLMNNGSIYTLNYQLNHKGGKSHTKNFLEIEKSRNWHWMWSKFYFKKKYSGYFFAIIYYFPILLVCLLKFCFYSHKNSKKIAYKFKFLGLFNSMIGKSSFYRPL